MKLRKASFGEVTKITLPHLHHNLWLKHFCARTKPDLSSAPKKSPLIVHFAKFNFPDVKPGAILAESRALQEDPDSTLPVLLNLQQPISRHYFTFCQTLLELRLDRTRFSGIATEASAHLFRALIAFTFQFDRDFLKLLEGRDSPFFPLKFFDEIHFLIEVLLLTKSVINDAIGLLPPLLRLYSRTMSCTNTLQASLTNVFAIVLAFLERNQVPPIKSSPLFAFAMRVVENGAAGDDRFALFCGFLMQERKAVLPLWTNGLLPDLLIAFELVLERITARDPEACAFAMGLEMLICLNTALSHFQGELPLVKRIFAFIEWTCQLEDIQAFRKRGDKRPDHAQVAVSPTLFF
jgi:hypothetical protein